MFRIKELAEARGLNITTLANRANMAYSQVHSAWTNGPRYPSIPTLKKIAAALDMPIWALFEGAPDPPS